MREVVYFKRRVYVRALHELGKLLFPEGLPPYPDWWQEIDIPGGARRGTLEGLDHGQRHDADQQQRGQFVEESIPAGRCARCGSRAKSRMSL